MAELGVKWTSERSFLVYSPDGVLDAASLRRLTETINACGFDGMRSIVPAGGGILVCFSSDRASDVRPEVVLERCRSHADHAAPEETEHEPRVIPICYDESLGLDLAEVAAHAGLPIDGVIQRHLGGVYRVSSIGFSPGFGYLAGVHDSLRMPRRSSPRTRIPGGSVGIAEEMTAVYPSSGAGGWNIIGASPTRMFDPHREQPSLLRVGERVAFERIGLDEFERMRSQADRGWCG